MVAVSQDLDGVEECLRNQEEVRSLVAHSSDLLQDGHRYSLEELGLEEERTVAVVEVEQVTEHDASLLELQAYVLLDHHAFHLCHLSCRHTPQISPCS